MNYYLYKHKAQEWLIIAMKKPSTDMEAFKISEQGTIRFVFGGEALSNKITITTPPN